MAGGIYIYRERERERERAREKEKTEVMINVYRNHIFKGLRPPAADPQQNEGMMLRGYENHEAIALVTCAS